MSYLCGAAKYYNRIPKPDSKAFAAKLAYSKQFLNEPVVCSGCGKGDVTLYVVNGSGIRVCKDCRDKQTEI